MAKEMCTIREANADEAPTLSALALRSKAHWGYPDEFIAACRDVLSYSPEQTASDNFHFFIAEISDRTVGFYALERSSPQEIHLEALFIEPEYIRQGYGHTLLEHAKARAMTLGAITMTIQGDPNAEPFYRSAGAKLTGQQESTVLPGRYLPLFSISLLSDDD